LTTKTKADEPSAEIRGWLDRCLVPQLVREYMAKLEKQAKIAAIKSSEVSR
jgi:hypothetical protein